MPDRKPSDEVIWHPSPLQPFDYAAHIRLGEDLEARRWEQLVGVRTGSDAMEVRCIPFFAYGIALGDVVGVDALDQVTDVIEPSGLGTIRIFAPEASSAAEVRERLSALGRSFEESPQPGLFAVASDAATEDDIVGIALRLSIEYEIGVEARRPADLD